MKLYGFGPTRSLRAEWALNEVGADYEFVQVRPLSDEIVAPEFLRLNPAAKVPVLVDGDIVVPESAAIVLYLAEKYPGAGLMPTDPIERAAIFRWVMFTMTELEQPLWRISRNSFIYPEAQRQPSDIAIARREFVAMAAVLDRHMQGREFIVDDRFTAADCVTAYIIDWADNQGLLADFPALRAYLTRAYARPTAPSRIAAAFAKLNAENLVSAA
jgi:glutathione S-transferase